MCGRQEEMGKATTAAARTTLEQASVVQIPGPGCPNARTAEPRRAIAEGTPILPGPEQSRAAGTRRDSR